MNILKAKLTTVLILVLVEDGLRGGSLFILPLTIFVLILVLVEDGLRDVGRNYIYNTNYRS